MTHMDKQAVVTMQLQGLGGLYRASWEGAGNSKIFYSGGARTTHTHTTHAHQPPGRTDNQPASKQQASKQAAAGGKQQ